MSAGQCFSWMLQCMLDINMQEEPGCLPMGHMQVCTPEMPEDCKLVTAWTQSWHVVDTVRG